MEEKLVQYAQALQCRAVGGNPAFETRQQLVHITQHLLYIQLGVFVLRDRYRGLQQRKLRFTSAAVTLVLVDQQTEIRQRGEDFKIKVHGYIIAYLR